MAGGGRMSEIARTMLVWCPDWPVTASIRAHGLAAEAPIALIEKGAVFACSATARRDGVKRGLRLREAQSRSPELVVLPYEAVLDARAFEPVVGRIETMMPGVQVLRPGVCALRVRGPSRYYGGERPAALALIGLLDELGFGGARVGVADGPFTAEQAARTMRAMTTAGSGGTSPAVQIVAAGASASFLAPLPVSLLDHPTLVTLLRRLGVRTMGDFAALPPVDVAARFGELGARLHSLAGGRDSRPVQPRIAPEELDRIVEFEPALDRIDQVTFGFRAAADHFIEALVAERLVCTAIRVEVDSESGELSERSWLHPRSFTSADVVDRLRWQLQGSGSIDSGLSSGIVRVRVVPEAVDAISNHEEGLWGTAPDERIHHGLSRVQSMLGHGGVVTAVVGGGRTLGDRQTLVAWGDRALLANSPEHPWPGKLPSPAPSTVFPVPHPVHVFAADGAPVAVDARGAMSAPPVAFAPPGGRKVHEVRSWAGPWPIDERWWDSSQRRRAHRFQVVDGSGLGWLLVLENEQWWAEARYD